MKFAQFSITSTLFVMILCDASRSDMVKQKGINAKKTFIPSKSFPHNSIKSPDGDIIDCIDIYQQPAFDHPLLKNHSILTTPSYYPEGLSGDPTEPFTQLWQSKGSCPDGTIPVIRRRTGNSGKTPAPGPYSEYNYHKHAVAFVEDKNYHGAQANINVWQPQLENPDEFSLAQISVLGGPFPELNTIQVGWHVFPSLNGDNMTRLFTFWTSDGYNSSGCYNLQCPGFVQVSNQVALGGTIWPVSTYRGRQHFINIVIWKDTIQNAWWLRLDQNSELGYWPAALFTHLADNASSIQWGGEVLDTRPYGQHTATQMGSGHFAGEGFGGASSFTHLLVINESSYLCPPGDKIDHRAEQPGCYNITVDKDDDHGDYFLYGGPGRNSHCS